MPKVEKIGVLRAELADRLREEQGQGRQLALPGLGAPELAPDGDAPADLQRGRPPGTLNAAPLEMRRWLLGMVGNPLVRLGRLAHADTMELARRLGCKPLELLSLQVSAARYLLPYVASPMPTRLVLDQRQWLALGMFTGAADNGTVPAEVSASAEDALARIAGLMPAPGLAADGADSAVAGRPLDDAELAGFLGDRVEPAAAPLDVDTLDAGSGNDA